MQQNPKILHENCNLLTGDIYHKLRSHCMKVKSFAIIRYVYIHLRLADDP